ncbi:MAG: cytochrome c3 family protein [Chloroflexi bacterium]|nr:cytochrome c3 family protein [Chloroflexota bacterium]
MNTTRRPWFSQPWARVVIGLFALILVGGAASVLLFAQTSTPEQPIEFPHNLHTGLGLQCRYCHPGVDWGPVAGLPTTDKCWGCHQQVQVPGSERLAVLAQYVENEEEIPWVPVFYQPDFVHFNHNSHINAGLECETCHGDLTQMTVAQPIPRQNMGWCLECHTRMRPEDAQRLTDCSLCHY